MQNGDRMKRECNEENEVVNIYLKLLYKLVVTKLLYTWEQAIKRGDKHSFTLLLSIGEVGSSSDT